MPFVKISIAGLKSVVLRKPPSTRKLSRLLFYSFHFFSFTIHVGGWPVLRAGVVLSAMIRGR